MDSDLARVCRLFSERHVRDSRLVLATVVRTVGSTYRKAGARSLIDLDGGSSGILSGGCLETELRERAAEVLVRGSPARIVFDTRESDDPIWGLGLGCEGVMEVWLQPATHANTFAPLPYFLDCWQHEHSGMVATVVGGETLADELGEHGYAGMTDAPPLGRRLASLEVARPGMSTIEFDGRSLEIFAAPVTLPPALLICGAGPDAIPLASNAASLGWRVTVVDHRPAYAVSENFPDSIRVVLAPPAELGDWFNLDAFDAAVIMSHHLPSDIEYLRRLSRSPLHYIGALGPAARRERLLAEIGVEASQTLGTRLFGPAGLAIGARTPESIALAIVAQIHSVIAEAKI